MGNLGAQKEKRNDTPISAKKDIMGDKTVRVRADLHHIIKIETAKNGGNVKEVMEIRLRSKLKSVLIVHYMEPSHERVSCITEPGFWTQTASRRACMGLPARNCTIKSRRRDAR